MPKNNTDWKKRIYIVINVFFLITAPFNLGYYAYSLIEELLPSQQQVAGVAVDNGNSDNSVRIMNTNISDNAVFDTPVPTPMTESAYELDDRNTKASSRQKVSATLFICINDLEPAHWSLFTHSKPLLEITPEELANAETGNLLIYCQSKLRTKDIDSDLIIVRKGLDKDQEVVISYDQILQYSYIILKYEGNDDIVYELRTQRP